MVTARHENEIEMDYDVTFRELHAARASRDVSSKDRFGAQSRFGRGGNRGQLVSGAHRRRDKRNYL